jgi:MFS family permease
MTSGSGQAGQSRPNLVLAMLLVVYIFNFVERQILAILAAPIQRDLALSDTQMGLLGGFAFALLYSTLAIPFARIADRKSRSWVIAISLGLWSLFTAVTGFAQGFWHIFLARLGVGIGEAGGVAPSHALVTEYFPPERRAFALSVYSLGIPLGSAIGVLAGGYIAAHVHWRAAFIVVGLAGGVLVPLFKALVRDRRSSTPPVVAASGAAENPPRLSEIARLLAANRSYWLLALGAASSSMLGYGLAFWMPSLLQRSFDLDLVETSQFIGAVMLLGGTAGVLGGGWLGDRLGRADRVWFAWIPAISFAIAVPLFAWGIASASASAAFLFFLIPQALVYVWIGPVLSSVQHLVAPAERATASALFLLINNLVGLGGGIYALGVLSDMLAPVYGDESLRYSMLWSLGLYGLAALLMALAGPSLRRDWVADAERTPMAAPA